jgi:hypothetical protein
MRALSKEKPSKRAGSKKTDQPEDMEQTEMNPKTLVKSMSLLDINNPKLALEPAISASNRRISLLNTKPQQSA